MKVVSSGDFLTGGQGSHIIRFLSLNPLHKFPLLGKANQNFIGIRIILGHCFDKVLFVVSWFTLFPHMYMINWGRTFLSK
jgi:hypothetical protein